MHRFVVIGLGHFGSWVARALHAQGHDVIAVDRDADLVDRYADEVTRSVVGDGTDEALLDRIGAADADAAVISTGGDLAASILATMSLRDLGLREIYVKVTSRDSARALEAVGVRETIFPEREVAYRLAHRITSTAILEYIPLGDGHSIQEIAIPDAWLGKSLRELELRRSLGIQVVALQDMLTGEITVSPDPDVRLKDSDVAIVAGEDHRLESVTGP